MANVVRFALSSARELYVPGVGAFMDGVLDVDANNLTRVQIARYRVQPYGASEIGIVEAGTPIPPLPTIPVDPPADPYPQYATAAEFLSDPDIQAYFVPRAEYEAGLGMTEPEVEALIDAHIANEEPHPAAYDSITSLSTIFRNELA